MNEGGGAASATNAHVRQAGQSPDAGRDGPGQAVGVNVSVWASNSSTCTRPDIHTNTHARAYTGTQAHTTTHIHRRQTKAAAAVSHRTKSQQNARS
jgi:hypothetical protein